MRVCESLSLNRWADNGHVHLYQRAVSRQSGDHLQIPIPNNPGAASIREIVEKGNMGRKRTTKTTTRSVATTTLALDDLARENGWLDDNSTVYIVLLKLDVEGAEPLVVEGAKALLKSGIVQNILTEAKNLGGAAMKQSMATILDAGYRIVRDDNLRNIRRLSLEESIKYLKYLEKHPGASGGLYNYDDLWFQLEESE
jgi:FkbM family methyltransferase